MDDDTTLTALLHALGWRVIRATDLPVPSILIPRYQIVLVATDLTGPQRDGLLDTVLAVMEDS